MVGLPHPSSRAGRTIKRGPALVPGRTYASYYGKGRLANSGVTG